MYDSTRFDCSGGRVDNTLVWMITSRDTWRDKCAKSKQELKISKVATKRARTSREQYKLENKKLKDELELIKNKYESHMTKLKADNRELVNTVEIVRPINDIFF